MSENIALWFYLITIKKQKKPNFIYSSERVKGLALTLDYMEGQAQEVTNHERGSIKFKLIIFA